ncbi:IS4 family transposase [Jeotgalibacillus malaysiensis]|uniref:IS4 family transposase n=1 Tax=Jeotgalibacillus malaysiensis TaxID=1508404 RepID=UPI00385058BB
MGSTVEEFDLLTEEIEKLLSKQQVDQIAKSTKFIQRERKIDAFTFIQLCLGESQPFLQRSLGRLCGQLLANQEVDISEEGLNQRFSHKAVSFLKEVFYRCLQLNIPTSLVNEGLFQRIRIVDSTSFALPSDYGNDYKGHNASGVKVQLEYDLLSGSFMHMPVKEGRSSDRHFNERLNETLLPGDITIRDLGYFSSDSINEIEGKGAYYITRLAAETHAHRKINGEYEQVDLIEESKELKKKQSLELHDVYISHRKQYVPRLIIYRLSDEQVKTRKQKRKKAQKKQGGALTSDTPLKDNFNVVLTNIPYEEISSQEVYDLYALRWQVEILFRAWKSVFNIHCVKKMKKERFECHLLHAHCDCHFFKTDISSKVISLQTSKKRSQ